MYVVAWRSAVHVVRSAVHVCGGMEVCCTCGSMEVCCTCGGMEACCTCGGMEVCCLAPTVPRRQSLAVMGQNGR